MHANNIIFPGTIIEAASDDLGPLEYQKSDMLNVDTILSEIWFDGLPWEELDRLSEEDSHFLENVRSALDNPERKETWENAVTILGHYGSEGDLERLMEFPKNHKTDEVFIERAKIETISAVEHQSATKDSLMGRSFVADMSDPKTASEYLFWDLPAEAAFDLGINAAVEAYFSMALEPEIEMYQARLEELKAQVEAGQPPFEGAAELAQKLSEISAIVREVGYEKYVRSRSE
jgi:hypothetical protein